MRDLAAIERYALALPLRIAADVLGTSPVGLRRQLAGGRLAGVKLADQWFLRRSDVQSLVRNRPSEDRAVRFLDRWVHVDAELLPAQLDLSEVELLLAERRTMLYRMIVTGSLPGVRGSDGWMISRDALLSALRLPAIGEPRPQDASADPSVTV